MRNPLTSLPKQVRRSLLVLGVVLVAGYLLVPQLTAARRSLDLLAGMSPLLAGGAVLLQATAMLAQAQLTRSVLPVDRRPSWGDIVRIELASTAVSHTVPGGTAAGTALAYRELTGAGVKGADAGFAVGVRGLGSALVLNVVLWIALVISIPVRGFHPLYTTAAVLAALLLASFGVIVLLLVRGERRAKHVVRRVAARLPFLDEEGAPGVVERVAERMRDLAGRPRVLAAAVAWSAAYWLGQAASLWVFLAAFGETVDPVSLLVAFGIANVLAVIPVTPRGLGVFEAAMIPLLVWFDTSRGVATLGVLGWRLVSFWLPIPAGAAAYVWLRATPPSVEEEAEPAWEQRLRELGEATLRRERLREWAEEHGVKTR